jgi:hypothetical protein
MHTSFGSGTLTAAGAVGSPLDTSGLTGDFTLHITITSLTAGKKAVIAVEDTASATPFDDAIEVAVFDIIGPIAAGAPWSVSKRAYELQGIRVGATNNKLRLKVLAIDSAASITLAGQLQQ